MDVKGAINWKLRFSRYTPSGDAAGTRYGTDGWDPQTAEAFADRVLAEAELHVPGLTGLVLERHLNHTRRPRQGKPKCRSRRPCGGR